MLFSATYTLPALAGWGNHWPLREDEAKELAEHGEAALMALPDAKAQALAKIVQTWGPVVGFVATAIVITGPRVTESRRLLKHAQTTDAEKRRSGYGTGTGTADNPPSGNGSTPVGDNAGNGWAPGTVKGTSAAAFSERDE